MKKCGKIKTFWLSFDYVNQISFMIILPSIARVSPFIINSKQYLIISEYLIISVSVGRLYNEIIIFSPNCAKQLKIKYRNCSSKCKKYGTSCYQYSLLHSNRSFRNIYLFLPKTSWCENQCCSHILSSQQFVVAMNNTESRTNIVYT